MDQIKQMMLHYMHKKYTDRHFLNIGMGLAIFARNERELFKAFYLENRKHRWLLDGVFTELREDMLNDARFADMPVEDRKKLLDKMWRYTFRLSMEICFDLTKDPSDEDIQQTLVETGAIIIADALQRRTDQV